MTTIKMDIPDAADAKAQFEKGEYEKAQKQAIEIAAKIKNAISRGATGVSVSLMEPAVKKELESRGYKVKYDSGGDIRESYPTAYYISWT